MKIDTDILKVWLIYGSVGLIISFCIILMIGAGLFYNEVYYTTLPTGTTAPSNTPIPTETATPTLTSTPPPAGPTLDASPIFEQAYDMMMNNDIQGAIDLLEENLDGITEHTQKTLATQTLGDLYSMKGDFQFAAVYYEQLYELEPNAFGLMLIANAYDAGGNLERAQEYYLKCLETYDPFFTDEDRAAVQARSDELTLLLTHATLTPVPTPTPE
jgi:hypothetical protein